MLNLRKLTADEVKFEVSIEPEDHGPEGAFASGDDSLDRADAAAIRERLENGDEGAWCVVVVTARWRGFTGKDSLGGCSLDDSYTAEVAAEEHDMYKLALNALNGEIAEHAAKLAPLCEVSQ